VVAEQSGLRQKNCILCVNIACLDKRVVRSPTPFHYTHIGTSLYILSLLCAYDCIMYTLIYINLPMEQNVFRPNDLTMVHELRAKARASQDIPWTIFDCQQCLSVPHLSCPWSSFVGHYLTSADSNRPEVYPSSGIEPSPYRTQISSLSSATNRAPFTTLRFARCF
jgi:hypothetical protein